MSRCPETAADAMEAVAKALGWESANCRGRTCGAKIYFARHSRTGNLLPIDASCGLSHHATCPDAAAFRARRARERKPA